MTNTTNPTERTGGLLRWQWSTYSNGHRDRANLMVHAATVPLFILGTGALPFAVASGAFGAAAAALVLAIMAIGAQGRMHRNEGVAPAPFRGPGDVLVRLFVEQWVTFPRYVLTGGFARALRASRSVGS